MGAAYNTLIWPRDQNSVQGFSNPDFSFLTVSLALFASFSSPLEKTQSGRRQVERRPTSSWNIMRSTALNVSRQPPFRSLAKTRACVVAQEGGAIAINVPLQSVVAVTIRSSTIAGCHALAGTSGAVREPPSSILIKARHVAFSCALRPWTMWRMSHAGLQGCTRCGSVMLGGWSGRFALRM